MVQKPLVYVSRVTNLSDARYCAGMGVDMLGFLIDPSDADYVSPETCQQLVGWVSGPSRVIETGAVIGDLESLRTAYAPEYLHVSWKQLDGIPEGSWKLIVETAYEDLGKASALLSTRKDIAHLLVSGGHGGRISVPPGISVLVTPSPGLESVAAFLEKTGAAGLALRGSKETAPGLKDYDHLSKVLEELGG